MSVLGRLFFGRWFLRWMMRGSPWAVAAKMFGVGLWGVWTWRREQRRLQRAVDAREIPADYEVIEDEESLT